MATLTSNWLPDPVNSTPRLLPLSSGTDLHVGKSKHSPTAATEPFPGQSTSPEQFSPLLSTLSIGSDCEEGPLLKVPMHLGRLETLEETYERTLYPSFSSYTYSAAANEIELPQFQDRDDQHHPGGVFPPVGDIIPSNLDILAFNPVTFNRNVVSFPQPTMHFFQHHEPRGSSVELPPRCLSAQAPIYAALTDTTAPTRVESDGLSRQLEDFMNAQNPLPVLRSNHPIQSQEEWDFSYPLSNLSQSINFTDPQAATGPDVGESRSSESMSEPFDLFSFLASNAPGDASHPLEDYNRLGQSHQNDSHSTAFDSFASLTQSKNPADFSTTPLVHPSNLPTLLKNALPEVDDDKKPYDFLQHEYVSGENYFYEKASSPPQLSSSSSSASSQRSSPSLSSPPRTNKNHFASSPYHPSINLHNLDENYSFIDTLTNSFPQKVENQCRYEQGSLEESFNTSNCPNSLDTIINSQLSEFENPYTHQQVKQQQLVGQQQLQQFWRQQLEQIENLSFSNTTQYSNLIPECTPKTTFTCPKCGKGHSRQSNLLAHLRDTHSDARKVFCDVPGCTKSYKRISECRRHKKDFHGIPLPSELNGRPRKSRSTLSSIRPPLKFKNLQQTWR